MTADTPIFDQLCEEYTSRTGAFAPTQRSLEEMPAERLAALQGQLTETIQVFQYVRPGVPLPPGRVR